MLAQALLSAAWLGLASAAPVAPEARRADVVSYLEGLKGVRVYFSDAPGLGHQAATLAVVRRLRELGYRREIEAVYADYPTWHWKKDSRAVPEKLSILVPGFDASNREDQWIDELNLVMRSLSSYRKSKKIADLTITGGLDFTRSMLSHLRHTRWHNPADLINSRTFLRLSPLGWEKYGEYKDDLWVKGAKRSTPIPYPRDATLLYTPNGESAQAQLSRFGGAPAKKAGLTALLSWTDNHDMLPSYGLHFFDAPALHRLLLGASHALDKSPEAFKGRGLIVPLLVDLGDRMGKLQDLLSHPQKLPGFHKLKPARQKKIVAANAVLRRRLTVRSIDDADLADSVQNLRPADILLLATGAAPPAVFERLVRDASLPAIVMGRNAVAQGFLLGKPIYPVKSLALKFALDLLPPERERAFARATPLLKAPGKYVDYPAVAALSNGRGRHDFETVGAYLLEALLPGGSLRRAFAAARLDPADYDRDKLLLALEFAIVQLRGQNSPRGS